MQKHKARLAVDIGGTFTDGVLEFGGRIFSAKIPTTPSAPDDAFIHIVSILLADAGISPSDVETIIHGTTLATNAIIERKGAVTAFITTKGFRDSLEIGYESRFDQYDLNLEKATPLVPRYLRLPVAERILHTGEIRLALDVDEVRAMADILRSLEVESVAIGFLHAYSNPCHEIRAREVLAEVLPGVPISISSEVCPEIREYERFSTTVADAYIKPKMQTYLSRLTNRLHRDGLLCPLFLVTSSGGITTVEDAMVRPVRLIESGPSGGATLAEKTARECQELKVLSYDMGGTTAKICLIDHFEASTSREFEAARSERFVKGSGLPLRIPVTEMIEIGAGGGSIADVDNLGRIQVGPDSAGADPGPACYSLGGNQATVTDADAVLGRLSQEYFAEGRLSLSEACARRVVSDSSIASNTSNPVEAAMAITEMVDENMANAARIHGMEHASDLREYTMVAFGGAGPLHGANLANKLGISKLIIPEYPGVGSALGFLSMPVSCELSKSCYMTMTEFDPVRAWRVLHELEHEANDVVSKGLPGAALFARRSALMRYVGQGHEIEVVLSDEVPGYGLSDDMGETLRQRYDDRYQALYGRGLPDGEIEVMTFTIKVFTERPVLSNAVTAHPDSADDVNGNHVVPINHREVFHPEIGQSLNTPVYLREQLPEGFNIIGPALIVERQTTTLVPSNFDVTVTKDANLMLTRHQKTQKTAETATSDIQLQIMWNRLQSIVDEQAAVLMRTAFSPIVRESGDLSVGIFNKAGEMLAQAVTGTPGHVNTMASACAKFFDVFPPNEMKPEDIYLTNDPWMGSGHLNDFVVLKPCFMDQALVGFISIWAQTTATDIY